MGARRGGVQGRARGTGGEEAHIAVVHDSQSIGSLAQNKEHLRHLRRPPCLLVTRARSGGGERDVPTIR
jgi:hypothetical protein